MTQITLPNQWEPRHYQVPVLSYIEKRQQPVYDALARGDDILPQGARAVSVWHRRAGKDSAAVNFTAAQTQRRVGVYWHMAPTAKQVRKLLWNGIDRSGRRIIDQAFPPELRAKTRDDEMFIELKNGSIWQCVGSDNMDNLVGSNPVGLVFSEWSLADPRAWDMLRPILNENGGWSWFIYTPRGYNHGYDLFQTAKENSDTWFSEQLSIHDTKAVHPDTIEKEVREGMPRPTAEQEYLCSFEAANVGAIYGELIKKAEDDGRITDLPYDPNFPVETWWDLGIKDSTAITFVQRVGSEIRIVDYYENSGVGLDHYAGVLAEKRYIYNRHIGPHDLETKSLQTGKTTREIAKNLGIDFEVVPKLRIQEGINATRQTIPRMRFDRKNCKRLLDALRQYQYEWDSERKTYKPAPLHDWSSHACDSVRYGCTAKDKIQSVPAWASDLMAGNKLPEVYVGGRRKSDVYAGKKKHEFAEADPLAEFR